MRLRSEVFVVEQDCVYLDLDDKDARSIHLFARDENAQPGSAARAVVRLVPPGVSYAEPSIGRVAIDLVSRGSGLGVELMERAIRSCHRHWPGQGIRISAQQYLTGFYSRLGFKAEGEGYLEDGIPHIQMHRGWCDLEGWKDRHHEALDAFEHQLLALPAAVLQGSKETWGGMQVLEHLMRSEGGTWAYLMKKSQAEVTALPPADVASDERGWQLVRALHSDGQWKDPTPGGMLSPEPNDRLDVGAEMQRWRERLDGAYGELASAFGADAWWTVQVFNHPIAGRLSLADTLAFGIAHVHHHVHQLKRLNPSHT